MANTATWLVGGTLGAAIVWLAIKGFGTGTKYSIGDSGYFYDPGQEIWFPFEIIDIMMFSESGTPILSYLVMIPLLGTFPKPVYIFDTYPYSATPM